MIMGFFDSVKEKLGQVGDGITKYAGEVADTAKGLAGASKKIVTGLGQSMVDRAIETKDFAVGLGQSMKDRANEAVEGAKDFLKIADNSSPLELFKKPFEQKKEDFNSINATATDDITDRDKNYVDTFNKFGGYDQTKGLAVGIAQTSSEFIKEQLGTSLVPVVSSYEEEKVRIDKQIKDEIDKKNIAGEFISDDDRYKYYELEFDKRLNEYLYNQGIDEKMGYDKELYQGNSLKDLFESSLGNKSTNEYLKSLAELNSDIAEEIKRDSVDLKSNVRVAQSANILSEIDKKLVENLTSLDLMKFQSLGDLNLDTDEAKGIVRNINLLRDAKKRYGLQVKSDFQNAMIENSDKNGEELLNSIATKAFENLSKEDKAVLHQQDTLVSGATMFNRIGQGKKIAGDFINADTYSEKSKIFGSLMWNTTRLLSDTLVSGITQVSDVVLEGMSEGIYNTLNTQDGKYETSTKKLIKKVIGEGEEGSWRKNDYVKWAFYNFDNKLKTQEEREGFGDNYEYTLLNDGWFSKGVNHIVYNLDDITNTFIPLLLSPTAGEGMVANGVVKSSGKLTQIVNGATKFLNTAIVDSKVIKFTIGVSKKPIIAPPLKVINNAINFSSKHGRIGFSDIVQGALLQNPMIDRNTLQASSSSNDVMNMFFDGFGGRVFSGMGYMGVKSVKYSGKSSVSVIQGIYESVIKGTNFNEVANKIAKEYNISGFQAGQLAKGYKSLLGKLSEPLSKGKDIYNNVLPYMKDLENAGLVATDYGNIVKLDNLTHRFNSFVDKKKGWFENTIMNGSDFDAKTASAYQMKNIDDFKKVLDKKATIDDEVLHVDKIKVDDMKKKLDQYKNDFNTAMEKGDKQTMLQIYNYSDSLMRQIYADASTKSSAIKFLNTDDGLIYSLKLDDLQKFESSETSIDQMLKDGLLVKEKVGEVKEGNYKYINNLGNSEEVNNIINFNQSYKLDKFKKKDAGNSSIVYSFKSSDTSLYDKVGNFFDLKLVTIKQDKKVGDNFKVNKEFIYGLGNDIDDYFAVARGTIENKKGVMEEFDYLIPGKKLNESLLSFTPDLKKSNYTLDIFNLAIDLGLTKENKEEVMMKATELFNATRKTAEISENNFDELFEKTLNNFKEVGALDPKIIPEGEDFRVVVKGLYENFKIDSPIDNFFLRSFILKLGRNIESFNKIKTFLLKDGKTVNDIQDFGKVLLGNNTRKEMQEQLKDVFYMGDLEKEFDDIIEIDYKNIESAKKVHEVKLKELLSNKENAFGETLVQELDSQIKYLENMIISFDKKIDLLKSDNYKTRILNSMYSSSLDSLLTRNVFDFFIKVDNSGSLEKRIMELPEGIQGIDLSKELGLTPNEIKAKQKLAGNLKKEQNDLKSIAKEVMPKEKFDELGDDMDELIDFIDANCR